MTRRGRGPRLVCMSTTSIAPAPPAGATTPPAKGPARTNAPGAVRAFGVVHGGALVPLTTTAAAGT
jgi:hypothetical protein